MHEYRPNRGRVSAWRSGAFLGIAVFFAYASVLRGQDVVEAARQEQAHKAAQKNTPKHIYTEEDLKKDRILTPDDQARVAARKPQQGSAPGQESAEAQKPAEPEAQTESLGEFARRYRKEKEERQAEEARKKNYTPFDYELTHPAVAAPKAGVVPLPEIRANQPHANLPSSVVSPGAPPRLPQPIRGGGRARVSPFQPRPLPVAPPAVRVIPVPAPPAITSVPRPAPPSRPVESVSKRGLRPVVVQTGDSWWRLASRYLGSGSRWRELRALIVQGNLEFATVALAVFRQKRNTESTFRQLRGLDIESQHEGFVGHLESRRVRTNRRKSFGAAGFRHDFLHPFRADSAVWELDELAQD